MKQTITGEAPFQVLATNFSISPSNEGYTLQISADGTNYSDLFAVGSDTTRMVTGVSNGSYFRLKGNESTVVVNWVTQCSDGGSGGGGSQYILPPATQNTLGGIKVGEGLAITNDGTLSTSGGSIDSGAVQTQIDASLNANNEKIEEGEIIAGMAKQLYSPDGVTSVGTYAYRTTAGDEDVSTGIANLKKVEGNATFPETTYNDSAVLNRGGEPVEGFEVEISQGVSSWETFSSTEVNKQYRVKKARYLTLSKGGVNNVTIFMNFCSGESTTGYYQLTAAYNGTYCSFNGLTGQNWETTVTGGGLTVNVSAEGNNLYYEIVDGPTDAYIGYMNPLYGSANMEVEVDIPNDIPVGESTYTYSAADTAWTPSLPQAVTAMTLNSETYVPQDGDEIVINRYLSASGSVAYAQPSKFVALGLNSFTKDGSPINLIATENHHIGSVSIEEDEYGVYQDNDCNIYAIKAITGLEKGYVVYHKSGSSVSVAGVADKDIEHLDISYSATVHTSNYDIVYPTDDYPYIVFSLRKDDEGTVCVHPQWSGYRNEDYEDYVESSLDVSAFNTDCPLISIGDTRNEWDFENMKLINRFEVSTYSAEAVQDLIDDGKVLGTDFEFDEDNIYVVADEPTEIDITDFDNEYQDNDFSVEYLVDENDVILSIPVGVTTWYMNNLVDKLRRLEVLVHLDNLKGTGNENTIYEFNGKLWYWSDEGGAVAEWTDKPDASGMGNDKSYGLIFSHIPSGQKILGFKYQYGSNFRYIVMSGDTLVLTEADNTTVVATCALGSEETFQARDYGNIRYVKVKNAPNYIGFELSGGLGLESVWDGKVTNGHFCITDHTNYPYLAVNGADGGIPQWNNKGQVIHRAYGSVTTKSIYFNNTGYSNNLIFVTTNSSGPQRMFVPTQSGNQGQVLTSAGNAEPTWQTMIKVVKITSDAYEALVQAGTTDANTLYAIVDE